MKSFKYEAFDKKLDERYGFYEANSKEEAVQQIRSKGLFVYQIQEAEIPYEVREMELHTELMCAELANRQYQFAVSLFWLAMLNVGVAFYGLFMRNWMLSIFSMIVSALVTTYSYSIIKKSRRIREVVLTQAGECDFSILK